MEKTLMRKYRPHGSCESPMKPISLANTTKKRDDLVYLFENGHYTLLQVKQIEGDSLICDVINADPRVFQRHDDLDFGLVGVFKDFGNLSLQRTVHQREIAGKLLRVRGLILTAPRNVLIER